MQKNQTTTSGATVPTLDNDNKFIVECRVGLYKQIISTEGKVTLIAVHTTEQCWEFTNINKAVEFTDRVQEDLPALSELATT